jgi:hypothetical protein
MKSKRPNLTEGEINTSNIFLHIVGLVNIAQPRLILPLALASGFVIRTATILSLLLRVRQSSPLLLSAKARPKKPTFGKGSRLV